MNNGKKKETLLERAFREVPNFKSLYDKMKRNVLLSGKSESTLNNYTKTTAKLSLHFGCTPLELTDAQINDYLLMLRDNSYANNAPSLSYFKHTVYGLRYLFRLVGREDKAIRLPSIKKIKELPSVLSRVECRRLFRVPKLLKHRILLSLIYLSGLRCVDTEIRFLASKTTQKIRF